MYAVMFVCHGNICRSPLAEFLFKDMLAKAGRSEEFVVSSSAVSDEEIPNGVGNPVYPPVRALLNALGISSQEKRAVRLTAADGEKYDLFVCMDESNLRGARRIVGAQNEKKCRKLLSFAGEKGDVSDPWYSRDFQRAYRDIRRGLEGMLRTL